MGSYHGHRNNFDHVVGTNFGRVSAEALFNGISTPTNLSTFRWTSTLTSRLLTEVTFAYSRQDLYMNAFEENYGRVPLQDWATGEHYNTSFLNIADETHRRHLPASVSYVTGSHNCATTGSSTPSRAGRGRPATSLPSCGSTGIPTFPSGRTGTRASAWPTTSSATAAPR